MAEIQSFFSGISQAVSRRDGALLAKVLALPLRSSARATPILRLFERLRAMGIPQACSRFGSSIGYPDMISYYLSAADAVITGDYENGNTYLLLLVLVCCFSNITLFAMIYL